MSREQLLATTFVELADTIEDDFEVLDFLQNLAERSSEIMGAAAAALILADQRGNLQLVASTTHTAQVLELLAPDTQEGPCVEAFTIGEAIVNVPDHEALRRWPRFTQTATSLGFTCVQVFPLRFRSQVLGALSLLFTDPVELTEDDRSIGAALVGVASIGLLQERTPRQKEILAERLQSALTLRVVIEQAKGVVAERAGVGVDTAFDLMNGFSRRESRRLSDVAAAVLDGSLTAGQLDASSA